MRSIIYIGLIFCISIPGGRAKRNKLLFYYTPKGAQKSQSPLHLVSCSISNGRVRPIPIEVLYPTPQ
jgi:hypothetical protein